MTSQLEKNFDDIKKSLKSNRINPTFDADPTAPAVVRRFVARHNAREAKEATENILQDRTPHKLRAASRALCALTADIERKDWNDPDYFNDVKNLVAHRADQIKHIVEKLDARIKCFGDWRNGSLKQGNLILSYIVAINDGVSMLQKQLFQLANEIEKRRANGDADGAAFCVKAVNAILDSFGFYSQDDPDVIRQVELYLESWSFIQEVDSFLKWFEPIPEELQHAATK